MQTAARQMTRVRCYAGALLAVLLLSCATLCAQTPVPELRARITDLTATFDADQTRALDDELAALEQRRGAQIAVLMISTLAPGDAPQQPDTIEQFATRVFDSWKLGHKGVDDGVLLIVVKDDHKVRIEVGYGLEGTIPDVIAARIIREYIAPKFRDGDYYGGVQAATRALASLIDGSALPEPLEGSSASPPASNDSSLLGILFATAIASLMLGFLFACVLRSIFNIFPIRVLPIGVRRVCGLLAAPLIIAAVYVWTMTQGDSVPRDVSAMAPPLLAAAITARLGWSIAAGGASQNWFGGLTWGDVFTGLFEVIIIGGLSILFGSLVEGIAGSSGSRGGYSGGGGRSGGGGASGSW